MPPTLMPHTKQIYALGLEVISYYRLVFTEARILGAHSAVRAHLYLTKQCDLNHRFPSFIVAHSPRLMKPISSLFDLTESDIAISDREISSTQRTPGSTGESHGPSLARLNHGQEMMCFKSSVLRPIRSGFVQLLSGSDTNQEVSTAR